MWIPYSLSSDIDGQKHDYFIILFKDKNNIPFVRVVDQALQYGINGLPPFPSLGSCDGLRKSFLDLKNRSGQRWMQWGKSVELAIKRDDDVNSNDAVLVSEMGFMNKEPGLLYSPNSCLSLKKTKKLHQIWTKKIKDQIQKSVESGDRLQLVHFSEKEILDQVPENENKEEEEEDSDELMIRECTSSDDDDLNSESTSENGLEIQKPFHPVMDRKYYSLSLNGKKITRVLFCTELQLSSLRVFFRCQLGPKMCFKSEIVNI